MILPPFSAPSGFKDALHPEDDKKTYWFIFAGDRLLISHDKKKVPVVHHLSLKRTLYLGTLGDNHLYAGEADVECLLPQGWIWCPLRALHELMNEQQYAVAGRAMQLVNWDRGSRYCGYCGSITFLRKEERCRECSSCQQLVYPKLAPAIMALVRREEKILLARGAHFPENVYSVLAGYVDPGETLEQCVIREVQEEVGIQIKNLRYFGSQPWPFSYSLMVGFICEWERGEIQIDKREIEDAGWFDSSHLPTLPAPLSLARLLIDSYLNDLCVNNDIKVRL